MKTDDTPSSSCLCLRKSYCERDFEGFSLIFGFKSIVVECESWSGKNDRRKRRTPDHRFKFVNKVINMEVLSDTNKHYLKNHICIFEH